MNKILTILIIVLTVDLVVLNATASTMCAAGYGVVNFTTITSGSCDSTSTIDSEQECRNAAMVAGERRNFYTFDSGYYPKGCIKMWSTGVFNILMGNMSNRWMLH